VGLAAAAGVRHLALTHHDPTHDDAFVEAIEKRARRYAEQRGYPLEICCAYEGLELAVEPHTVPQLARTPAPPHPDRDAPLGSRILVADDDPDIRILVHEALSQDGHIVSQASTGQEALALIDAQAPDLLVLDLIMPKQGGLEVLKLLRSRSATATLPVLVLTSLDDEVNTRASFDLGATDYLTKPFSIPQLAARVRACLSRRG